MPEVDPASPVPPSNAVAQDSFLDEFFQPKFTVVTVTYNAEKTLERTIQSVAAQTYRNIEHLIVDGLSTDGTLSLIQEYAEENSVQSNPHDIKLIREVDNGLYDAMNKAIDNASGDYLVFLNAGDTFHSAVTIERVVDDVLSLDRSDGEQAMWPAVLYGETDLVDNEGNFLRHRRLQTPGQLKWTSFKSGMLVCHQSFYVLSELARNHHYDLKYRFSADFDWCIRIMKDAHSRGLLLHNTRMVLTDYLSEGMTTKNRRKSLLERFRIMARHYGYFSTVCQHLWFVWRAVVMR